MTQAQNRELAALNHAYRTVGLDKAGAQRKAYLERVQRDETERLANMLCNSKLTRNKTLPSTT